MSDAITIHGSCHCGDITFQAGRTPLVVVICHCTDCQKMSGGPHRSIVQVKEDAFSLLSGEPKPYFKVGDSGNRRELSFCANCGSHLYATSVVEDVPEDNVCWVFVPDYWMKSPDSRQDPVWCQSRVPWADDISSLPGTARQS